MATRDEALRIAGAVAERLAGGEGVRAVGLGGSLATGRADASSDVDLYLFGEPDALLPLRRAVAAERALPGTAQLDSRWFGPDDEWHDRAGAGVDLVVWDPGWVEGELAAVMERHEPRVGYTTAVIHTLAVMRPLHDPSGWLAAMGARARAPYPEALARAVAAHNLPLLRAAHHSFLVQVELAAARDDPVSVNHRTAAWLASLFDVLFAVDRRLHPGEKRLLDHAATLQRAPRDLGPRLRALLAAPARERAALMRTLAEETEALAATSEGPATP